MTKTKETPSPVRQHVRDACQKAVETRPDGVSCEDAVTGIFLGNILSGDDKNRFSHVDLKEANEQQAVEIVKARLRDKANSIMEDLLRR